MCPVDTKIENYVDQVTVWRSDKGGDGQIDENYNLIWPRVEMYRKLEAFMRLDFVNEVEDQNVTTTYYI